MKLYILILFFGWSILNGMEEPPASSKSTEKKLSDIIPDVQKVVRSHLQTLEYTPETQSYTVTINTEQRPFFTNHLYCAPIFEDLAKTVDALLTALEKRALRKKIPLSHSCSTITITEIVSTADGKRKNFPLIDIAIPNAISEGLVKHIVYELDTVGFPHVDTLGETMLPDIPLNNLIATSHVITDPYDTLITWVKNHHTYVISGGYIHIRSFYSKNPLASSAKWFRSFDEPYFRAVFSENRDLSKNKKYQVCNYKFHLMPHIAHIKPLIERITTNKNLMALIRDMKLSLYQDSFDYEYKTELPRIVLYVKGKKNAQKVLDLLIPLCKDLACTPVIPRFSAKVTDVIYYAQGNGDDKMEAKNDDYFEQPHKAHFIHTYEDPINQDTNIYHLKW